MKFVALLSLVLAPLALASCPTTEVLFARGTFEPQGDGWIVGPFLRKDVAVALPGSSFYNIVYPATPDFNTSTPVGTADIMRRLTEQAQACPETEFALAGYSQGISSTSLLLQCC
jgi:cutinase